MPSADPLAPGANAPLAGTRVQLALEVPQLGGATLLVEENGHAGRVVAAADGYASVGPADGRRLTIEIDLAAVPAGVERLRLLVWSPAAPLALGRAAAEGSVDGAPAFCVELPPGSGNLSAAELLELYRRGEAWKVRAIASGWHDHVPAMAAAVGVDASDFPVSAPVEREAEPEVDPAVLAAVIEAHEGPSPPVGPPALRDLLDMVVGPGARFGDDTFVDFALHGVPMRLAHERSGDFVRVVATTPAGEGAFTDVVALAALRATGEAPLARVSFVDDDAAFVSAPAIAHHRHVDTSLLKALLAEVWVTAYRFAHRVRTARWTLPPNLTETVPRELRLGVAEELQDPAAWTDVRERLAQTGCVPLVDEPAAMLAPSSPGQLAIGPCLLAGTPRAWTILVERTVRADVRPEPGLWRALAGANGDGSPVRFAVQAEGLPGDPPAIQVSYSALQLPRTQVLEDLGRGLDLVDRAADDLEPMLRALASDASTHRDDLPWTATRRWTGPGSELREHHLIREVAGLPGGAVVPARLLARAKAGDEGLGRPGHGYLAHLALQRAEARDASSADWQAVARQLVALAPVQPAPSDAPCATASIHARLRRLDAPRPVRYPPAPPQPTAAPTVEPGRRRRGLFG